MVFDFFLSFVFHDINGCSYSFKMINMIIAAVLPVVFTSSFGMKTPNQTFEGYMYQVNRRKRGLPKTCS